MFNRMRVLNKATARGWDKTTLSEDVLCFSKTDNLSLIVRFSDDTVISARLLDANRGPDNLVKVTVQPWEDKLERTFELLEW